RIDAAAPGIGGVAGDDEVIERDLAVNGRHGEGEREQQRRAAGIRRPRYAGELHDGGDGEQDVQRKALDQAADRDLRHGAAQEYRRGQAADGDERNPAADALVDDFRQRHRDGVEHQAGAERYDDKKPEND